MLQLWKVDGFLACNFTEDELKSVFLVPETGLVFQCVSVWHLVGAED